MQNFLILLFAMSASGAIGFYLARDRYLDQRNKQLHVLGTEILRMRRRTQDAELKGARFKSERDRMRRTSTRR